MKLLHMYFSNVDGRRVRITVRNARDDLTSETISDVMDLIVAKDVFYPSLVSALEAQIEERTVTEI